MAKQKRIVVLVHGWSVRNTDTYGGLPERLKLEARRSPDLELDVHQIWLSEYISFHNEVTIPDIARAFQAALKRELGDALKNQQRFVCITHSTGAPVIRAWLHHFYIGAGKKLPPLSHLIMLAPANFGSALVQLGLSKLSRLKAWFEGVDVGTGVLDWLELGSDQSLALNLEWLQRGAGCIGPKGFFPFVL
ncbi:MAG: alpha/beta hydrolase, partial [Gammaproteobacteria bacterium]|nr:alpha/beta hydrolase [Gammaproteobacteria bacterium]